MTTHHVSKQHIHTNFDKSIEPVVAIDPGQHVALETLDACWNEVRSLADFEIHRHGGKPGTGNPITGPVRVRGAKPGQTLVVEIVDVDLDPVGFQLIGPNRAVVRDEVPQLDHYTVAIDGEVIRLPRGLHMPVAPVIGTMGVAPAGNPSNCPGPWGGNMDVPQITVGAHVYLPVLVEGAMFSLGDVHARQGDGEVVGAPEIAAAVTVKLDLLPHRWSDWPVVEHDDHWYAVTCGPNEAEGLREGVFACARLAQRLYGLSFNDALILMTMSIQLHCSRTGDWGDMEPVICSGFSKTLLEEATREYEGKESEHLGS